MRFLSWITVLAAVALMSCGGNSAIQPAPPAPLPPAPKPLNSTWQFTVADPGALPDGWPLALPLDITAVGVTTSAMELPLSMQGAWRAVLHKDVAVLHFKPLNFPAPPPGAEVYHSDELFMGTIQGYWCAELTHYAVGGVDSLRFNLPDGDGARAVIYTAVAVNTQP